MPGEANALLSANRDADCLYAMVSDYCPGSINAMDNLDINIPVYVSNANTETPKYVKKAELRHAQAAMTSPLI